MTVLASGVDRGWDARILATDIDTHMVDTARHGIYAADAMAKLPPDVRTVCDTGSGPRHGRAMQIRTELRQLITFKPLNLLGDWPMRGPFDVIFCRNVLIYFDARPRRADRIVPDSCGRAAGCTSAIRRASARAQSDFELVGRTIYRRAA